jgi:hypothetical protein
VPRLAFFCLLPLCAGWLTVFQLRGWGQVEQSGSLGWAVVAIAGLILAALVATAKSRISGWAGAFWVGLAAASFVAGVGIGSAAFDRYAALGGLQLTAVARPRSVEVNQSATVRVAVRNTSDQAYGDVKITGGLTNHCLNSHDAAAAGLPFDVGPLAAGQSRAWDCDTNGSLLYQSYLFANGDPTDNNLAGAKSVATQVQADLTGFRASFVSPSVPLLPSDQLVQTDTGGGIAVVVGGQPTTYQWKLTNIGQHARAVSTVVQVKVGRAAPSTSCRHLTGVVAPGQSVALSCRITLSTAAAVTLAGQDPRTHHGFVQPSGVGVQTVPVVPAAVDPAKPLSIQRSVETYVGSGQYAAVTYGSSATRIRVVNGPQPTADVAVVDTKGTCAKSRSSLAAHEVWTYTCTTPVPATGATAIASTATVIGFAPDGTYTPADGYTTLSNPALTVATGSLPFTGNAATFALVGSAINRIKRHFVGAMALVTLLSALLLAYDRWAVQPSEEPIPVPEAGSGDDPRD